MDRTAGINIGRDSRWQVARPLGYGWLMSHATEMPVSPAILNAGLVGIVALAAALAWYAFVHAPALAGKLLPQ